MASGVDGDLGGERDALRSTLWGCFALPVGLVLAVLALTPLLAVYALRAGDGSIFWPLIFSVVIALAYALAFGVATAWGLPRSWWMALICILGGAAVGIVIGAWFHDTIYDACLLGSGSRPGWCDQDDPVFLRSIVPAYSIAFAVLGLVLWVGAALNLGRKIEVR